MKTRVSFRYFVTYLVGGRQPHLISFSLKRTLIFFLFPRITNVCNKQNENEKYDIKYKHTTTTEPYPIKKQ